MLYTIGYIGLIMSLIGVLIVGYELYKDIKYFGQDKENNEDKSRDSDE